MITLTLVHALRASLLSADHPVTSDISEWFRTPELMLITRPEGGGGGVARTK